MGANFISIILEKENIRHVARKDRVYWLREDGGGAL